MLPRKETANGIEFTKIKHDVNGNPRYVCHFLNIADDYKRAVKLANQIGGKKYHTKSFGGGVVFQAYNIRDLASEIEQIAEK